MEAALAAVRAERHRQIAVEHRYPSGDDAGGALPLVLAARAYIEERPDLWPWDAEYYKPKGRRRDLERAGALVTAACEVMCRRAEFDGLAGAAEMLQSVLVQLAPLMPVRVAE